MTEQKKNLDWRAAHHAQEIIKSPASKDASKMDNTVTKTLGVLQENGIYACALFLLSRPKEEVPRAKAVMTAVLDLLAELDFGWGRPDPNSAAQVVLEHISDHVTSDKLERVLLAKETLEQMLIYARYGAKAAKGG